MGRHGGRQPAPSQPPDHNYAPEQYPPQVQYPPQATYPPEGKYDPRGHYPPPGQYPPQSQYGPPYDGYQQGPDQPVDGPPPQGPPGPQYQQGPGPQYAYVPSPQQKKRHWVLYTLLGAGAVVAAIVVVAVIKTAGGASTVTIKGTVTPASAASSVFGSGINATSYAECAVANPKPGTQVTVSSPSGQVIGTSALGIWADSSVTTSGVTIYLCDMPFTIKNVPSEQRYGFSINGVPGTIWETSISGSVNLSVNSNSG